MASLWLLIARRPCCDSRTASLLCLALLTCLACCCPFAQVLDTSWAGPPVLTPAALSGMQQLRAVSLHLKIAAETASSLQALPRLELLFLH